MTHQHFRGDIIHFQICCECQLTVLLLIMFKTEATTANTIVISPSAECKETTALIETCKDTVFNVQFYSAHLLNSKCLFN